MLATVTAGLLAGALGLRHAFEPDHLAAVSTMVAERRGRGAWVGAVWGLGHTLSLLCLGVALVAVRAKLPAKLDDLFELVVAATLLVLGARALLRARAGRVSVHRHRAPLVVGALHGLAGTGALTALVMASLPGLPAAIGFMACFGLGAIAGMAALGGAAGWALRRATRTPAWEARLLAAAGALSLLLGAVKGWPLAVRLLGA